MANMSICFLFLFLFLVCNISVLQAQLVSRLNDTEINIVIDMHNNERKAIGAANMKKMVSLFFVFAVVQAAIEL
jgi:hypothetical protein